MKKTKRKSSPRLKSADTIDTRKLDPIPEEARTNPINWATEYTKSLVPESVKNIEYSLKFGDTKTRLNLSLELMAMHGLSSKGPQTASVVPAIQLILPAGGMPWDQQQQPRLPATVDGEVVTTDAKESKK